MLGTRRLDRPLVGEFRGQDPEAGDAPRNTNGSALGGNAKDRPLAPLPRRARVLAGVLGLLVLSIAVESSLGGLWNDPFPRSANRQCAPPRDCGGFDHVTLLGASWLFSAFLWHRFQIPHAKDARNSILFLAASVACSSHVNRVLPDDTEPSIRGAYVVTLDGLQQVRMRGLLASFPEALVHFLPGRVPLAAPPPGTAQPLDTAASGGAAAPATASAAAAAWAARKRSISLAHLGALEAISAAEDLSLRDAHGRAKHWFLVFEEDADVSSSALEPASLFADLTEVRSIASSLSSFLCLMMPPSPPLLPIFPRAAAPAHPPARFPTFPPS